nr:MucBP domain-containing protein [Enterococcus crotali]
MLTGKLNDSYETSSKRLNNWQLRDLPQNSKGLFTAQEQIVTYVYEAEKNEVPTNSNNFPTVSESTLNQEPLGLYYPDTLMPISETRTVNDSLLPPTKLPTILKKEEGTFVIEPKIVKEKKELKKKKKTGTVTIKYVDENGHEISSSSTLHGEVGDSFSATAKDISH